MTDTILTVDHTALTKVVEPWRLTNGLAELPCEAPEHAQWWADKLNQLQAVLKNIEAERVALKAPVLAACRDVDAAFRQYTDALDETKTLIAGKLSVYKRLESAAVAQAQDAAAAVANDPAACAAALAQIPQTTELAGVRLTESWTFTVLDLGLVPKAFLKIDEAAIKAHIKTHAKRAEIPPVHGIQFERTVTVAPTGRT